MEYAKTGNISHIRQYSGTYRSKVPFARVVYGLKYEGVCKRIRITRERQQSKVVKTKHYRLSIGRIHLEHFDVFKSIKIEYGKTGQILKEYSRCTSRHGPPNTSEYYRIRCVCRSVFERIRARMFAFLCSVSAPLFSDFMQTE